MNAGIAGASARTVLKFAWCRAISTSTCRLQSEADLIAELKRKIAENHRILKKHSHGQFKARSLTASNANLKIAMQSVQRKIQDSSANSVANIPSHVSIEVLANGSGHLRSCVVIRTPLKTYMFNCPEGASRFLPQLRLKALNITDIFVTRASWDNIAGISSVLLSKEANAMVTRLHGAVNIKNFLECIRPFQDSDYGSDKYPSQVEEYPFSVGSYEDAGLKVTYIPLCPPMEESISRNSVDIAYLVELKESARRIDARKLISMQVPKGPLIGKLKNGESVTLPDGRVVNPEDVLADPEVKDERKRALFVDCATEAHLTALKENTLYCSLVAKQNLDYMIHFSPAGVISLPGYGKMVKAVGAHCQNIVVNETTPFIPGVESIYRNHTLLNSVCEAVFPPLHPFGWKGLITQGKELQQEEGDFVLAAPLQRFWMRQGGGEEPILADLRATETEITDEAKALIEALKEETSQLADDFEFPKVSFLGTSSAVPSKYRNVTGYLLEASPTSALMVDVGEGSYGQMKILLGKEGLEEMLLKMRAVLITHAHQDHMNGLHTIIQQRRDVFQKRGNEYVPLVLVCNRNVLKPLKTFSLCFEDVESLVSIVDISRHPITPPPSPGAPPNKRRRLPSPNLAPQRDVLEMMPPLFSKEDWNIQEIKAVQVHHTRMANGFVITVNGKRVVFSGDTKPCDLLVEEGQGADVLIHEATFEDGHEADAHRKKHSTMGQAIDVGQRMNAKNIILTHFSARYPKVPALPEYLDHRPNVSVAMDNMSVRFDHLPLLPKLIPIYREIYREELFEIEIRQEQRNLKAKNGDNPPKKRENNAVKV